MFESKKTQLFAPEKKESAKSTGSNAFVNAGLKKSAETRSGNGALKYETTGNLFVDEFGQLGSYKKPRTFAEISESMSKLWAIGPVTTIMFVLYIRLITRVTSLFSGVKTKTVQRGAGLRHEGIMRMIWLHINHQDSFWKNISLFISAGSWKDVITMLQYDLVYNGWDNRVLDWGRMGKLILAGLENPSTRNLVLKYLPQIKARSKCTTVESQADTMIAKWICALLFNGDGQKHYAEYRKLKTSGNAHVWQKLISQGKHNLIDFKTVHGRALALMVSSKYITNQGLEKDYEKWIESQPIAKFTGYPHELFENLSEKLKKKFKVLTVNSQFMGLVETAKKNASTSTSMICVRDTSGSMSSGCTGTKSSCGNVAKALALFFSYMLPDGHFANSWIEFNSDAKMHTWKGSTPVEKWTNDHSNYIGNTNFQSVIKLFCKIKSQQVPESQFPSGIICLSDGEFDPSALNKTNVQSARKTLLKAGFSEDYIKNFKIVLWNLQSGYYGKTTGKKFETHGDVENVYYFSGFSPEVVAFLTGVEGQESTPKTAAELFNAAMDQELLKMVEV